MIGHQHKKYLEAAMPLRRNVNQGEPQDKSP
ncbi:hypothetical protein PSEUDO9AZ_20712 [Pseudomonas sp. 9AZ]|nr:hypothetical protein PSEUDO9AZ_20712 [Pseudomonas sp. 9AZ]